MGPFVVTGQLFLITPTSQGKRVLISLSLQSRSLALSGHHGLQETWMSSASEAGSLSSTL